MPKLTPMSLRLAFHSDRVLTTKNLSSRRVVLASFMKLLGYMKQQLLHSAILVFAITFVGAYPVRANELRTPSTFRVVSYLPDYRLTAFDPNAAAGLTDLVVFSAELAEDGSLDMARLKNCPWPELLRFKTQQRIRLLLTIGGWERSRYFASVVRSPEKRARCVEAIVQLCLDKRLDGIDLDWEHPQGATDNEFYGKLLGELRQAFDPHGLVLSVTIASWQGLPAEGIAAVDYVQVMAYDADGKHSTFEYAKQEISAIANGGVPAQKIVLGLPFYGRDIKTRRAMTYGEIVAKFNPAPAEDQVGQMYFNGPDTIRRKVKLAISSKLGGVMAWELGQDASGHESLLKAIRDLVDSTQQK